MKIWHEVVRQLEAKLPCILISIIEKKGSVPRGPGTRMLLRNDGSIYGTIGGGQLEWSIMQQGTEILSNQNEHYFTLRNQTLGPGIGQCCGGSVTIGLELISPTYLLKAREFMELEQKGGFQCKVKFSEQGKVIRDLVTDRNSSDTELEGVNNNVHQESFFIEDYNELWRQLIIFGAGHIGQALMLAIAPLPFDVTWVDSRKSIFPKVTPKNFNCLVEKNPVNVIASTPDDSFIIITTHSHALDQEITYAALQDDRFAYVGLIGSKSKKASFKNRLLKIGLTEAQFDKLVCPIGIDSIQSKNPAEIATAIAAQLLIYNESNLG